MPDFYYSLAARMSKSRRLMIACVAFGLVVAPLIVVVLERGQLYGVALMAAGWWPIGVMWWFHPQRRPSALWLEKWLYTLLLDWLAFSVVFILYLAVSKNELPSF